MNAQLIRKLREERAWSQEHLAAAAGLSLRTIQRVEAEGKASAETRLSLAAALGVEVAQLSPAESLPSTSQAQSSKLLSRAQYNMLRLGLVALGLVGLDMYRHDGSLTWSRWALLIMLLVLGLRWLRQHFVEPRHN